MYLPFRVVSAPYRGLGYAKGPTPKRSEALSPRKAGSFSVDAIEVSSSRPQEAGIVAQVADAKVAAITQQTADLSRRMTVVDAWLLHVDPADGTLAVLRGEHFRILVRGDSVLVFPDAIGVTRGWVVPRMLTGVTRIAL